MAVEVTTWEAPVIQLDAVFLTNSNIEDVANWIRADFTEVLTDIRTKSRKVRFMLAAEGREQQPGATIVVARVGQYVVRQGAHINQYGEPVNDHYYSLTEEDMQTFYQKPPKE